MSAFDSNNSQETPEQKPESTNVFTDQLKNIVNESGEQKYDSVDKALEALKHSQSYIPELKTTLSAKDQEIQALKEELAKRAAVEDVVAKLTAEKGQQESTPQAQGLGKQEVEQLFQDFSAQQMAAQSEEQNEKSVSDSLLSTYGDKTGEVVAAKAAELGMSVEDLKALSRKSPQAAMAIFNVKPGSAPKYSSGSINIPPNQKVEDELRKPEKSLLQGASTKDQVDYLREIRRRVYKKYDIQV